jgi:hypothetical protein
VKNINHFASFASTINIQKKLHFTSAPMVNSDVSQTLALAESVRQWSSSAVTAQLDSIDDYLQHQSCFLGRTARELLGLFASGECAHLIELCPLRACVVWGGGGHAPSYRLSSP